MRFGLILCGSVEKPPAAVDLTDTQGNKLTRMKFGFFDMADAQKFAQGLGAAAAAGMVAKN